MDRLREGVGRRDGEMIRWKERWMEGGRDGGRGTRMDQGKNGWMSET